MKKQSENPVRPILFRIYMRDTHHLTFGMNLDARGRLYITQNSLRAICDFVKMPVTPLVWFAASGLEAEYPTSTIRFDNQKGKNVFISLEPLFDHTDIRYGGYYGS